MALEAIVTKTWPSYNPNSIFNIGVEVVLNDDDTQHRMVDALEQKRQTFYVASSKNAHPETKATELVCKIQEWIDAYKEEKAAHKHAKYETMRAAIASGLNLTE